ncbi:MAG: hypothetical protein LBH00_00020 [Planctomycetaceae bacterium]|jgi:tetratricopeptide (TPR) repeat protein|nr:hypothetical protein [Planctomycetaceae bacterium]
MFRFFCVIIAVILFVTGTGQRTFGQKLTNDTPSPVYFNVTLPHLYHGNFTEAVRTSTLDLKNAVKIPDNNGNTLLWLDSLCYWTIIGECHFQMGRFDDAFHAYTAALRIYFMHPDWLKRISVTAPPALLPRVPMKWGKSARPGHAGNFQTTKFRIAREDLHIVPMGDKPGLMTSKTLFNIHADQVVSCLALTIRRRAEILGGLSKYDPDTKRLADILAARPCLPNHFTGSWIDVLFGLTLSAMGDDAGAEAQLNRGLLMMGTHDHQLTAAALNELGRIAERAGKPENARNLYLEASYAAYLYLDPILLGETFRNMNNANRLIQRHKPFSPFVDAFVFFSTERNVSPLILLPILFDATEDAVAARKFPEAAALCDRTGAIIKGTPMIDSQLGARHHYLAATADYIRAYLNVISGKKIDPKIAESGSRYLHASLDFMRHGSLRIHQLNKLEEFFQRGMITSKGPVTERVADELYSELLRESTENDWLTQPIDCFAALTATPLRAYEHWFAVAYQRGNREKAFDISEKMRRARFFAALPTGESRLLAFRMLFEGNDTFQTEDMLLQRQTLALDFKEFRKISEKVRQIKRQLVSLGIMPQNAEQISLQKTLLGELEKHSAAQEAVLRVMALSRTKVPPIFPPVLPLEELRKSLPDKTTILSFTEALGNLYGFLIDNKSLTVWQVFHEPKEKALHELISDYLQHLGNRSANAAVSVQELTDSSGKWKESGAKLLKRLLGNEQRKADFTDLVIVPTGSLWYVPFEAMSVQAGGQYRPLMTAGDQPLTIRYAPTASLAVPDQTGRSLTAETLVLCGKLAARDSYDVSLEAVGRFAKEGVKNLVPMKLEDRNTGLICSAPVFASQIPQLVVLDDIPPPSGYAPLQWSPFRNDKGRDRIPAAGWLHLPWGGPQLLVLPGFHSPAEISLQAAKTSPAVYNGDDLFLSAMLLEACGAKTVLISRWRTGGRIAYDLTGQFLLQYASKPAAAAWRQAILEVGVHPLNLAEEPRVKQDVKLPPDAAPPVANHPFFWSSFMLIDRGEKKDE